MEKRASNTRPVPRPHPPVQLQPITLLAKTCGADDALILPAADLLIREELARLCGPANPCPSYGLAPGCPPHAMPPDDFKRLAATCAWMLCFKINASMQILLGPERRAIARKVHQLSAALARVVEQTCACRAHAYASGSCYDVFCLDKPACVVLAQTLPCPHSHEARPSLSGVGVDFQALASLAGWPFSLKGITDPATGELMGLMAGLVLIEDCNRMQTEEDSEEEHAHR